MKRFALLAALAAALFAAACSKNADSPSSPAAAPLPPPTPEQAALHSANALLDAIRSADPLAVFQCLPPVRQQDIRSLLAKAVSLVDEDLWRESASFLSDFAAAAEKQSGNLASLANASFIAENPDFQEIRPDDIVNLARFLSSVAAIDRQALADGRVENLLQASSLREILAAALDQLLANDPEAIPHAFVVIPAEANSDSSIALASSSDPQSVITFSLVDGVWFNEDLDKSIAEACQTASDALDDFSIDDSTRATALSVLRSLRGILPTLAAAQSPEQLQSSAVMGFGAIALIAGAH